MSGYMAIAVTMVLLYNAAIVALFSWVVFIEGRSGWWFVLAICLMQLEFKIKNRKAQR